MGKWRRAIPVRRILGVIRYIYFIIIFLKILVDFGQFFSSFCAVILFAYLGLQFGPWASWWIFGEMLKCRVVYHLRCIKSQNEIGKSLFSIKLFLCSISFFQFLFIISCTWFLSFYLQCVSFFLNSLVFFLILIWIGNPEIVVGIHCLLAFVAKL